MSDGRDIVIRGGRVLDIAAHRAEAADIHVRGDTIVALGPPGLEAPADARVVAAGDRLLMPGLVNAHTHGHGSLAKGVGDRWTLELLLNAAPWISGARAQEDVYLAAVLNAVEMVRKGCTAAYDLYVELPLPTVEGLQAVRQGYADVGVRAVVAPMMADRLFYEAIPGLLDAIPAPLRGELSRMQARPEAEQVAALRRLLPEGRTDRATFDLALAPTIPLHCSDGFLTACRDLAREYDTRLHMHLAESKTQAVSGPTAYGRSLTAHLAGLDFIGPNFTGAHCIWLDDDDIRRLADAGATIAHNPGSNLRLGSGIARARAMLDAGVTLGVGTDGSQCSDNQNLFEAMRLAAFVSRVENPEFDTWVSAEEAFHMATEGGAAALGLHARLGRIAPGYQADIVLLDLTNINYVPLNDALQQVVFCEDGSAVDSVFIAGRAVLRKGHLTALDEPALRQQAQAATERLLAANTERRALATRLEPYVGAHCVGLGRSAYPVQRWVGA